MAKEAVEQRNIPVEVYNKLNDQFQELRAELETYQQRSPIVGVCWYGAGGFGIGLTNPINGVSRISLNGYGDKCVIDLATWTRIKNVEQAKFGLLVRDDSVIEELHITGVTARKDVFRGPNSFTNEEVNTLLKGSLSKLNEMLKQMDSHWGPIHFLNEAKALGITTPSKIQALKKKRDELATQFRWSLLHPHDLKLACEQHNVKNWESMTENEMVKVLAGIELEENEEFV